MIVYATLLRLEKGGLENYFKCIADSLSRRLKTPLTGAQIRAPLSHRFNDDLSSRVETWLAESSSELLHCARLSHSDSEVSGRLWKLEVGLTSVDREPDLAVSVLLETSDISTRVQAPVFLKPPKLVAQLIEQVGASPRLVGATVGSVDERTAADRYTYELLDPQREHAVILLSPRPDGSYALRGDELQKVVVGLAEIWVIPPTASIGEVNRSMQDVPAPYGGAVTIVYPRRKTRVRDLVPSWVLTVADLEEMRPRGIDAELLALLTHRFNLAISWQHTSPDRVREVARRHELGALRNALERAPDPQAVDELINKVAEDESALRTKLQKTAEERDEYMYRYVETEDILRATNFKCENLKQQLAHTGVVRGVGEKGHTPEFRSLVTAAVLHGVTVESALDLSERLFADRVVVLDSAKRSAKDQVTFKYAAEAFQLLCRLCDEYWILLADGKPDGEARKVFGQYEFAAKEANLSKDGARARTFEVPGRGLMLMEPHLKIQRGYNASESWRCHFEWLDDMKKLVIGHCGEHLPA
jgi:hypothetical protein